MRGLFITGTSTEVGKTYVAALIARQLLAEGRRAGVYKPVASGCRSEGGALVADDALALWHAAGRPGELERVCPQRFAAPLAPHLAAKEEERTVDSELLRLGLEYWRESCDIVLVEGAGGLMSPVSDDDYNADLAADFGLPLVVVAPNVLGTINATLQTLITAHVYREGLAVAGVVLNSISDGRDDPSTNSNRDELKARCVPPVLAAVEYRGAFDGAVDWWALAEPLE
jgi:dethiobiotin synthetase